MSLRRIVALFLEIAALMLGLTLISLVLIQDTPNNRISWTAMATYLGMIVVATIFILLAMKLQEDEKKKKQKQAKVSEVEQIQRELERHNKRDEFLEAYLDWAELNEQARESEEGKVLGIKASSLFKQWRELYSSETSSDTPDLEKKN
jgi:hypothetical protein